MLYNSDGLPGVFMVYQKCIFLNVIGTFYQELPYIQTKIKIGKICNMKISLEKMFLVFKKPFSKRYIWKKGGRLIFGSMR